MNVETLHDLFVTEIQRLYGVETELLDELETLERDAAVDALDDLGETEARESLREALSDHRAETETHVERLETALEALGYQPDARSTPALDGLIHEKELFNNVVLSDELRPVYYLDAARAVERLEITGYERVLAVGQRLDAPAEALDALEATLEEEKAALERLDSLANEPAFDDLFDAIAEATAE